jgi:hypothetical protein
LPVGELSLTGVHIEADQSAVIKYAHMKTQDFKVEAAQGEAFMIGPDVKGLTPIQ